jgi:hypothetical protein
LQDDNAAPAQPEKVQPTIRDALIGIGIGVLLIFSGLWVPYRYLSWPLLGLGWLFVVVMAGFVIVTGWERFSPTIRQIAARARGHVRHHSQLGALTRNTQAACWEGAFYARDGRIRIVIDGGEEPDPKLVAHARDLIADIDNIQRKIDTFLADEAKREADPELAAQIAGLRVAAINVFSKKGSPRSNVDLKGEDVDVFWSCTLINGKPENLWFD